MVCFDSVALNTNARGITSSGFGSYTVSEIIMAPMYAARFSTAAMNTGSTIFLCLLLGAFGFFLRDLPLILSMSSTSRADTCEPLVLHGDMGTAHGDMGDGATGFDTSGLTTSAGILVGGFNAAAV